MIKKLAEEPKACFYFKCIFLGSSLGYFSLLRLQLSSGSSWELLVRAAPAPNFRQLWLRLRNPVFKVVLIFVKMNHFQKN